MGANNCKSAADMQPLFDEVFDYSYAMLALDILYAFLYWVPYGGAGIMIGYFVV